MLTPKTTAICDVWTPACTGICVGANSMQIDACLCVDMCVGMFTDMHVGMFTDMCVGMFTGSSRAAVVRR